MKMISDVHTCKDDGDFEWKGYILSPGEVQTFKWDEVKQNFGGYISDRKECIVICPKCQKRYIVKIGD